MLRKSAFALFLVLAGTAVRAGEPSVTVTVNGSDVSVTVLVESHRPDQEEPGCEELGFLFAGVPCS